MDIRKKCQPHLWLLTGTGEGHAFAKSLLKEGWKITVSVVSERASIPYEKLNLEKILIGALISEEDIRSVIFNARNNHGGFHCVIDLTHPFALKITSAISNVCKQLDQPFIRYERPKNKISNAFLIKKFSDLGNYNLKNKSILLALGVRSLREALLLLRDSGANVYARVLANPESIKKALSSSIIHTNFAVLNPSGSSNGKIEQALIRRWAIDGVICRQSGGANEMLWHRICSSIGIDLWLLERPCKYENINSIDSYDKLSEKLKSINML
ncbi:precorrin-6A/cobalt-precorrin-6A reductase [Prochlorococcus marinus]|uniref:Precorrin-6A reductase n=1 Tax=Prochlorococcus marinus XMU1408 TaxID=2213228 RepID=A0A318R460_PROMR|nr:precorrin-6A/cobalt-precorrin-6A reductase [Prochlorococcus marinus]MBW3041530.1 precorrin-6A reductase [Prochlorococcus marinus str. XMU1408]PYE02688.1 precorrin-6A reductase [Prochlorococcus marinus XMU1408]